MKHKTKYGLMAAALLWSGASLSFAQTSDYVISSFDSGTQGSAPSGVGIYYGSSTATWDGTVDDTGNSGGSLYITCPDDTNSDTPLNPYICINGGNPWNDQGHVDLTQYKSIDFDIKWDNTSALTVDQFNQPATWPAAYGGAPGFPGSDPNNGINIRAVCGGNGTFVQLIATNIPTDASNGWVHMSIPIDSGIAGIDDCNGINLEKWINNYGTIIGEPTVHFWIDNVTLIGTAGPPPPPTVKPLTTATPGLNIFASTEGNSFYDRQEAELVQNTGLSWVGHATAGNPVTYSFTITNYPNSVNCEAYMFLVPNPAANDSAPDWNETNCIIAYIQGNSSSATMRFQYKVNEPGAQDMYSGAGIYTNAPGSWDNTTTPWPESGNLGSVTNNGVLGTWKIQFTSDSNITLIAPDGNSSSFTMPSYNTGYFAESSGFNIYLGMQANQADAINQAVVYSDFSATGVASPVSDNFLADSVLDTNVWSTSVAGGPAGVLVVPSGAAYWLSWTLPDAGFSSEISANLTDPLSWNSPANNQVIPMVGIKSQLISTSDLPAGDAAFFRLVKRQFSQLQVLLPGETNAPNTPTGKTGTPTSFNAYDEVDVTINAVDSTFHILNASDAIDISTTDSGATITTPNPVLASGTVTVPIYFGDSGSFTVTATDLSNTNIPAATSSSITIN